MLRHRGHECWTAGSAGLARAKDDELTVWAVEHQAVLVSTDTEFSQRRMRNSIGHHVWLRCNDWEASEVLANQLDNVLNLLEARSDGPPLKSEAVSASWPGRKPCAAPTIAFES